MNKLIGTVSGVMIALGKVVFDYVVVAVFTRVACWAFDLPFTVRASVGVYVIVVVLRSIAADGADARRGEQ